MAKKSAFCGEKITRNCKNIFPIWSLMSEILFSRSILMKSLLVNWKLVFLWNHFVESMEINKYWILGVLGKNLFIFNGSFALQFQIFWEKFSHQVLLNNRHILKFLVNPWSISKLVAVETLQIRRSTLEKENYFSNSRSYGNHENFIDQKTNNQFLHYLENKSLLFNFFYRNRWD